MPSKISLQIKHESCDLEKLASDIKLPVARIWAAGAERKTVQGALLGGSYEDSYLSLKIECPDKSIGGAISLLKNNLIAMPEDSAIFFAKPDLKKTLYCTLISGGEKIGLDMLRILVDFNINLEID
ncbi:hypothetical protein RBH89_11720 [Paracidovorax avenae]